MTNDEQMSAGVTAMAANDADANQAYGALTEGLYLASHTFERAMAQALRLLKDGSWRLVGSGFDDVNAFIRSLKLDQFKIVADQRKEFAEQVRELQPQVSNRAIAKALGVGHDTVDRDLGRGANAPDGRENANPDNGRKSGGGAYAPAGAYGGRRDARIVLQRDYRRERVAEKLASLSEAALLAGLFSVQVSDPPLTDKFGPSARQVEVHYPVMSEDSLLAMAPRVRAITAEHAVHFMWVAPHLILVAARILEAWGFEYSTHGFWDKGAIGLGQWFREEHEDVLIGRKGEFPPPPESLRVGSVLRAPRGRDSEKPEMLLELIEDWWPPAPKIELFRRGLARPGWAGWGNETADAAGEGTGDDR